jgi:hypothetical protein
MTVIHHVSRCLALTDDQLDELAQEFAEYAALDIADIMRLHLPFHEQQYRVALIAAEVNHAIQCTIATLTLSASPARPYDPPGPREVPTSGVRPLAEHTPLSPTTRSRVSGVVR